MNAIELSPLYGPDGHVRSLVPISSERDGMITFGAGAAGSAASMGSAWMNLMQRSPEYRDVTNRITKPYIQHSTVYAAIKAVADRVRAVPFGPWEGKRGTREIRRSLKEDKWSKLWRQPNPETSGSLFWAFHVINFKLFGESLWLHLSNGKPCPLEEATELWHLNPKEWGASVNPQSRLIEYWEFTGSGERFKIDAKHVTQFKNPNPYNPYRGVSDLEAAGLSIQTDLLFKIANRAFVESGFNLGGVLVGEEWGDKQQEHVKQILKDRYAGSEKTGNILVLGGSRITYTPNPNTHRSMQYNEGLIWNRGEILAAEGVPEGWVSMGSGYNFATMSADDICGWTRACLPIMSEADDVLWHRLYSGLGRGERWFQFDYDSVPALREARMTGKVDLAIKMQQLGYPLNMINQRHDLGMPDVPWGNEAFVNGALVPASFVAGMEALPEGNAPDAAAQIGAGTPPTQQDQTAAGSNAPRASLEVVDRLSPAKRLAYTQLIAKSVMDPNERTARAKVKGYFGDLRGDVMERFRSVTGYKGPRGAPAGARVLTADDIEAILAGRAQWDAKLLAAFKPVYLSIVHDAAKQLGTELGGLLAFKESDPAVTALLERRCAELVQVNDTTQAFLRSVLTIGSKANEDLQSLAKRINAVFNNGEGARSLTIARTETSSATNGSRFVILQGEGTQQHQWATAGDDAVRELHVPLDGQVRDVGMPFSNRLRYPGDPAGPAEEVVACRCVAIPMAKPA